MNDQEVPSKYPVILAIEGLHRSGKTTNLALLSARLRKEYEIEVRVLRGHGSRPGNDSKGFYDPPNEYWKQWHSQPKEFPAWEEAYEQLNKENLSIINQLAQQNTPSVVLMDRCYLSRAYLLAKNGLPADVSSSRLSAPIRPEHIFVLHASKETLINRTYNDTSSKASFRRTNIKEGYPAWSTIVSQASKYSEMHIVDAQQTIPEVHEQIWGVVKQYYENRLQK